MQKILFLVPCIIIGAVFLFFMFFFCFFGDIPGYQEQPTTLNYY